MSLTPGTRLGPYEVVAKLGEGGMGEVYRARDTKLDRNVALKILPESFATDTDRLMRFDREAKTLAALNHPNIAAIHGIEEGDGAAAPASDPRPHALRALVMELVEGEDLSERIARGAIEPDEALPIARQIAEALEAAHEAGVVHRDLKPANIKVRSDGTVKVLDFGLAKGVETGDESSQDAANSPTLTARATQMGIILGTAAYMAPEQARGKPVDRRADVWAFGCVLFEMLAGQRAFGGDDISMTLASVLKKDLDWTTLPDSTPPPIRRMIERCFEIDPRRRYQSIGDARYEIEQWIASGFDDAVESDERHEDRASPAGPSRTVTVGLAVATVLATSLAVWTLTSRVPAAGPTHLSIALPHGHSLTSGPAISPDGQTVAFSSTAGIERPQLYVRRLDEPESQLIEGTEGATQPFFSPDGQSVAFYTQSALFKVRLDGSAPMRLADSGSHYGAAWLDDGRIVFNRVWNGGLHTVPENGGAVELLVEPNRQDEYAYVWPHGLPGSREILFARWGDDFTTVRLDLEDMTQTIVSHAWRRSVYSETGHLVFGANAARELWVLPYPDGAVDAGPVPVADQVDVGGNDGDSRFDISANGTLAYASADRRRRSLVVVDRLGRMTPIETTDRAYDRVSLSPDGHRVIFTETGGLTVLDLERGTTVPLVPQLLSENGAQIDAIWSSDGRQVTFDSNHTGNWEIYSTAATGVGGVDAVLLRPGDQNAESYAPDGTLLFSEIHIDTGDDLWMLPADGDPVPWLATDADEAFGRFSPDGQLVALMSNASGRFEVYIQTRDPNGQRVPVSANGGIQPMWSPTGDRLFFRQGNAMMEATVDTRGGLLVGTPTRLFDGGWELAGSLGFDIASDGESFLMIRQAPEAIPTRIDIILNWFTELERRVAER